MLNVSIYKDIKDGKHLNRLMAKEPDWTLLENKEIVDELFHLNGHFDIVSKLKPTNVEQLAAVLAIIRPAKRHLVNSTWQDIEQEVWQKPLDNSYFFKKARIWLCSCHSFTDEFVSRPCELIEEYVFLHVF